MAFQTKRNIVIQIFVCSLLSVLMVGHGVESDVSCLRSIKDSLEDPLNRLLNWKFNNITKGFICDFVGVSCWNFEENRVLGIDLSDFGLKGQFPRGLENCSSLTRLNLSFNELTGPIPSDISTLLPFAVTIDLSYNKFNGEIPASLGNCTYLNYLKLDNNLLSGHIPRELGQLPVIKSISFANNNLSGPVPLFFRSSTSVNYTNNGELCGGPWPPCPLDSSSDFPQSFKNGLAVGYAFSVTSVIVIYISYCAPWEWEHSKHRRNKHRNKAKEFGKYIWSIAGRKTPTEAHTTHELQPLHLQQKAIKEVQCLCFAMAWLMLKVMRIIANFVEGLYFPQSFKEGLAVGYAFSVTSVIVLYMSYCAPWKQSKHQSNKLSTGTRLKNSANIFGPSQGGRHQLKLIPHTNCNLSALARESYQ